MSKLDVISNWERVDPAALRGHAVVVVDVLRWSTVVLTALYHGAECVEAWATPEEARARAMALGRDVVILGGERNNRRLEGFDLGNSPFEYSRPRVEGKVVVTTTTNGTNALLAAREAESVFVGAFVNLSATLARVRGALARPQPVTIICAGQQGTETLEDTALAGSLVAALLRSRSIAESDRNPEALRALAVWQSHAESAVAVLRDSRHAKRLVADGFEGDVIAASLVDSVPLVGKTGPNPEVVLRA